MPTYRLYRLNDADQILEESLTAECADDRAAMDFASTQDGAYAVIEIWQERRLIGRVPRGDNRLALD